MLVPLIKKTAGLKAKLIFQQESAFNFVYNAMLVRQQRDYGKFLVPKVSPAPYKQKPQPRMLSVTLTSTSGANRHPHLNLGC
ncbi:hypothetical protein OUZ56_015344 [Daphnia magna]|uniref:Uncharacterized protein n=1 Tax=Daphnia magna TaxID=35525 RepID=A0ABR0AMW8_9CRUS|nr:hypothetical protein OUZ56_015344 [Daphnia magna]